MFASGSASRMAVAGCVIVALVVLSLHFLRTGDARAQPIASGAWRVSHIGGFEGEIMPDVQLSFDGSGSYGGFGGCNQLMGRYVAADQTISINGVVRTRKKCPPQQMRVEEALVAAMETAGATGTVLDGKLTFVAGGRPILVLER